MIDSLHVLLEFPRTISRFSAPRERCLSWSPLYWAMAGPEPRVLRFVFVTPPGHIHTVLAPAVFSRGKATPSPNILAAGRATTITRADESEVTAHDSACIPSPLPGRLITVGS